MKIRTATLEDAAFLAEITAICFSSEEAITKEEIEERLKIYPEHFWLLEEKGKVIAYINGMVSNKSTIQDDMFKKTQLHEKNGVWQTIFGVNTLPEYRRWGYAGKLMKQVIADAKEQGRRGCILTCKKELINYYKKFGYKNEGVSKSNLANETWYDMCLEF